MPAPNRDEGPYITEPPYSDEVISRPLRGRKEQYQVQPKSAESALVGTDLEHIILNLLPEVERKMRADAGDYGHENHRVLGAKGQFADIWRKIGKLKRALWDGVELQREQPREILLDLIGHCFLTIAMIDRDEGKLDA